MATRSARGGGNSAVFYPLLTSTFGTVLTHVENKTKSTKVVGHPSKNSVVIDFDALHGDSDFHTFLESWMYSGEVVVAPDKFEDSSQDTTTNVPQAKYLGVTVHFGTYGTNRKIYNGVVVISGNTGDITTGEGASESTPVQITAVAAPTQYTVTSAQLNATYASNGTTKLLAATADVTIGSGTYGKYSFITAGT